MCIVLYKIVYVQVMGNAQVRIDEIRNGGRMRKTCAYKTKWIVNNTCIFTCVHTLRRRKPVLLLHCLFQL